MLFLKKKSRQITGAARISNHLIQMALMHMMKSKPFFLAAFKNGQKKSAKIISF